MLSRYVGLVPVVVSLCLGTYGCESATKIRIATTTSVENSGLLTSILPAFESDYNVEVQVLPVGSGRAFNLLRRGDVVAGLTHAPKVEAAALEAGVITNYRKIMFNDFIIVGPLDDPAAVKDASDIVDALKRIVGKQVFFVSRGDSSGTYLREQELWALAERRPADGRLVETGQGMAATLRVASEYNAYTLTDRATFQQIQSKLQLTSVYVGETELVNPYAIFQRSGLTETDRVVATALVDWFADGKGRQLIASFRVNAKPVFQVWPAGFPRHQPGDLPHAR